MGSAYSNFESADCNGGGDGTATALGVKVVTACRGCPTTPLRIAIVEWR